MIKLKRLIQEIPDLEIKGPKEIEITGICAHSKSVSPGNLFIAKKGKIHDGAHFINDAIEAGAVCVLTDLYDPFLEVTQLIHPNIEKIEAKLASKYYHYPSQALKVIGITGTNGKSTAAFLIKELLDKSAMPAGLIGTIEWIVGEHHYPGKLTTPDVITSQKLLKEMRGSGCKAAVMEVSSHALDQGRTLEIDFSVGLFTNFSRDHLDYHKTMDAYKEVKEKLFSSLGSDKWAIFNADDPISLSFSKATKAHLLTYAIENEADVMAKNCKISDKGVQFILTYKGEEVPCKSPLMGIFNIYNLLSAISVGLCFGISLVDCAAILKNFHRIPGRLERVKNSLGINIFVDHAHSPDALENVLSTLQSIKKGKLLTVFGCGGDRDKSKRSKMGEIVSRYCDEVIITNDNPRTEDPVSIAQSILEGVSSKGAVYVELDRKKAIEEAIDRAKKGDILLIAGKGHENEQILGNQIIPFNDAQITKEICLEKGNLKICG